MNTRWVALAALAALLFAASPARAQGNGDSHTQWWEHVHVDMMWPSMQWQNGIYGVLGMHVTTTVKGRFQIFTLPGVMLVNLPARDGSRVWKVATNYGIGYRLLDFELPGGRPAQFHVSFAKTYLGVDDAELAVGKSVDFVGFSLTFKRTR